MTSQRNHEQPIRIAVVGDIHDQWEADDGIALQSWVLICCLSGDFGNESVEVVRVINIPKAAVWEPRCLVHRLGSQEVASAHDKEDWVQEQLNLLGKPMAMASSTSRAEFMWWAVVRSAGW